MERPGRDGSESCGGILHGEVGTGSTRGVSELVLRRSTLPNGKMGRDRSGPESEGPCVSQRLGFILETTGRDLSSRGTRSRFSPRTGPSGGVEKGLRGRERLGD